MSAAIGWREERLGQNSSLFWFAELSHFNPDRSAQ